MWHSFRARLTRLKSRRRIWLQIHLWLGLSAGAALVIFGLTGSILVFHQEIDAWLNPKLLTVNESPTGYRSMQSLLDAGVRAIPGGILAFADYPRNGQTALRVRVMRRGPTKEIWEVGIDPYTGQVTGTRLLHTSDNPFPQTFIGFIFELHYAFFLGETPGYVITGLLGALLIISALTGLILWWPLTGRWRQALTIKRRASAERLNFDLHKTFGFYTFLILLPVLFSGIYMNLPQHVVPVLELFSPVSYRYWFKSIPVDGATPISMAKAVDIAQELYPSGRPDWIYGAVAAEDTYTVCLHDVEAPGSLLSRRCVVMDRYSGKLLDVDDPSKGTAGEVFTHWQWPLHSGHAFGLTGRLLVFASGLAGVVLFITGLIRWLQKRRATARMAHR